MTEFARLRNLLNLTYRQVAEEMDRSDKTVRRWEKGETPAPKPVLELYRHRLASRASTTGKSDFTFIDLFAGIGGMRLGFEAVGGRCVFTSEWNKFAAETYRHNFPNDSHEIFGDITNPDRDIPEHDVLIAGFPCQPFSIAGVSKKNAIGQEHGFRCKTQGTLFFEVASIIDELRPSAFLLENVKNLQRHDKGETFRIIGETLDELDYEWSYRIIDAKGYVPQHRERIFIIGFRRDKGRKDLGIDLADIPVRSADRGPKLGTVDPEAGPFLHPEDGTEPPESPYTEGSRAQVSPKYTLSEHLWEYLQAYAEKHRRRGNGFGFGLVDRGDIARTLSARYYKDGSEILIKQDNNPLPRRLTPRECARIMGFRHGDGRDFIIKVSDTQAYKQFGNSVVVPVVREIATFMKPYIMELKREPQITLPFNEDPVALVAG